MTTEEKVSIATSAPDPDIDQKKDAFLDDDEHSESSEKVKQEMKTGKRNTDVYTKEGTEELLDNDEISAEEAGFVKGAEQHNTEHEDSK